MSGIAFEKHYRVKELAVLWGLSSKTLTRIFADEAGVIRIDNTGAGKRKYATLSIPESVASRVHERLGKQALEPAFPRSHPLRVIHLSDLDTRVTKKTRNILQRNALQ